MVILSLTLSLFSILLYREYKETLYNRLDSLLLSKADGIVKSINTYWETEQLSSYGFGLTINSWVYKYYFPRIAQSWVENGADLDKLKDSRLSNLIVQIFDHRGQHIVSSKEIPQIQQLSPKALQEVLRDNLYFNKILIRNSRHQRSQYRQLTVAVHQQNKSTYIIQVASSLDQLFLNLLHFKQMIIILLPLTLMIASIGGVFLVRLTLRPVSKMAQTMDQITAQNLDVRLTVPHSNDELQNLAETFNRMLSKLHQAFIIQERFIQDASHELRTPLTILKGEIEVSLRKSRTAASYRQVLQSNLEEINQLYEMVDELLLLAKLDHDRLALSKESVSLGKILKQVTESIQVLADQKQIALQLSLPDRNCMVDGNDDYLSRLFLNLIHNAIFYTPDHGKVGVSLTVSSQWGTVTISDSGYGISPDAVPHLFDRFFREDNARHSKGFGLGLSIAESIVRLHSGNIKLKETSAQGSVFEVQLPLSD